MLLYFSISVINLVIVCCGSKVVEGWFLAAIASCLSLVNFLVSRHLLFQGYSEKFSLSSDAARRISAISLINIGWCGHILLHSPLLLSQPESAISMHNFSIIYKSLHKSRISWRGDSVGADVRILQEIFAVCLECYNGVASPAESNIPTHIQTFVNCCGQLRY